MNILKSIFKKQAKQEIIRLLVQDVYSEELANISQKEKELIRREIQIANKEKELSGIGMKNLNEIIEKQKEYQAQKEDFERKMANETDENATSIKMINHTLLFIKWLTKQDGSTNE